LGKFYRESAHLHPPIGEPLKSFSIVRSFVAFVARDEKKKKKKRKKASAF